MPTPWDPGPMGLDALGPGVHGEAAMTWGFATADVDHGGDINVDVEAVDVCNVEDSGGGGDGHDGGGNNDEDHYGQDDVGVDKY